MIVKTRICEHVSLSVLLGFESEFEPVPAGKRGTCQCESGKAVAVLAWSTTIGERLGTQAGNEQVHICFSRAAIAKASNRFQSSLQPPPSLSLQCRRCWAYQDSGNGSSRGPSGKSQIRQSLGPLDDPQPRPPLTKTAQPVKISFRFTCEATNLPSSRFLDEATGTNAKPPSTFRNVNHGSWGRQEVAASEDARDRDRDRVSRTGRKSARPGGLV